MTSRTSSFVLLLLGSLTVACDTPPPPAADGGGERADAAPAVCEGDDDCDDGVCCNGVETCELAACVPGALPCMPSQRCLEDLAVCRTRCEVDPDADGDGHESVDCGGDDCDDADAQRYPGNAEVCDELGRDEDCRPETLGDRDRDGDGEIDGACCNVTELGTRCGADCSDQRRDVRPGQAETCNTLDDDCDGSVDEGVLRSGYADLDFDLHGDASAPIEACADQPGFSLVADDCDDTSPVRHAAQVEICDGVDNDCDGLVDESPASIPWYADGDDDGFGDAASFVVSCTPVPGHAPRARDCDDTDATRNPAAAERCNGLDDDCDGSADYVITRGDLEDDDGDGVADRTCGGADCDDAVGTIGPEAPETCNGLDDDCDGVADAAAADVPWYLDRDGDGWGDATGMPVLVCEPPPARVSRGGDCDDASAAVHPGVRDGCDDDCDGTVDEDAARVPYFVDADGDGVGSTSVATATLLCRPRAGRVTSTGDCDDADAMRHPGATERCDGADDDCDGVADEAPDRRFWRDLDGDGRGAGAPTVACDAPTGMVPFGDDCDDTDARRSPAIAELCNGIDDDCDASVDEMGATLCAAPFAVGACVSGACTATCMTSREDCDGDPATGCEVDVARSRAHCGGCGMACRPGDTCGVGTPGVCDASPVVAIFGGHRRVFAVRENGLVVAWGENLYGALGVGGVQDSSAPREVLFATGASEIVSDATGSVWSVSRSGALSAWGLDATRLGGGNSETPHVVSEVASVAQVCNGQQHACARLADGTMRCWGSHAYGQLGVGAPSATFQAPSDPGLSGVLDISCGRNHTCALASVSGGGSAVHCWGIDSYAQLGRGTMGAASGTPDLVLGLPADVIRLSRGSSDATCAMDADGTLYCWGYNYGAYLMGLGAGSGAFQTRAVPVPDVTQVRDVTLAPAAACLLRGVGTTRELHCWGQSGLGVEWLGHPPDGIRYTPDLVGTAGDPWTDVASYVLLDRGVCALRGDGRVHCIGTDANGQLGNGDPLASSSVPVTVRDLP